MKFFLVLTIFATALATHSTKHMEIHIFNIGQADSQLVVFPSGYSILIDCGDKEDDASNTKHIAKRIEAILGKKTIDVLVITHYHRDHYGKYGKSGIWYLIEKKGFTFKKFINRNTGSYTGSKLSDCSKSKITWKYVGEMGSDVAKFICYATSTKEKTKLSKIHQAAKRCDSTQIKPTDNGAKVTIIMTDALGIKDNESGEALARNGLNDGDDKASENDYSICMKIEYNKFVYATCGDLSGINYQKSSYKYHDVETKTAPLMGEVDLYKVNHHGSGTSTNKKWANTLKPTVSVITCGPNKDNPRSTPMKNLKNVGSKIYTTADDCNPSKIEQVGGVIEMGDDIVIKVPTSGTKFTVATAAGKKSKSYTIKTDKKAGTCKKL